MKLKVVSAFTVLEFLVTLCLTSVFLVLAYSAFKNFQTMFAGARLQEVSLISFIELNRRLHVADAECSLLIQSGEKHFTFCGGGPQTELEILDSAISLSRHGVKQFFPLRTAFVKVKSEGNDLAERSLIRSISMKVSTARAELELLFTKSYDATSKLNYFKQQQGADRSF